MFKQCTTPSCPELLPIVGPAKCAAHLAESQRSSRSATSIGRERGGYDTAWDRLRKLKLSANPWCEIKTHCRDYSLVKQVATEVDHIKPIRTHPELRLVWSNLASACRPCHSAKTMRELRESKG